MRKNGLAEAEINAVRNGARRLAGFWGRRFRSRPVVADEAFQGPAEPYPGHWRRFPEPWPAGVPAAALRAALDDLPETWHEVLRRHDVLGHDDARVAADLGLTRAEERDILTRARARLRATLDPPGGAAP